MAVDKPLEELDSQYLFGKAMEAKEEAPVAEPEPERVALAPEAKEAAEAPVEPEAPAAEEPPKAPVEPPPEHQIPPWRLREEAEARRSAEMRAQELERRLNEITAHVQQQQKQPDFFENPDAATQQLIQRFVQPIMEEQRRTQMYNSKLIASVRHGEDKVEEAEQAFLRARDVQSLDPVDYERVVQAPNRYDAVVQWYRTQTALSTVGNDPEAWFQKRLEAALDDPKFQAQVIERAQKGAAGRPSMTKLPPSLSRTTAARGNADPLGDGSDGSLWSFATNR